MTIQSDFVRTYPKLSAACLREKLDLPYRLWLLLRHACNGQGWITEKDAIGLSCGTRRQTRAWIRRGMGIFWTKDDRGRLWLAGLYHVRKCLGIQSSSRFYVPIPKADIENLQKFRAKLFEAWFVGQRGMISQAKLCKIFGKSRKTIYTWTRLAGLEATPNIAWARLDKSKLHQYPSGIMRALGIKDAQETNPNNVWIEHWDSYPDEEGRYWRYRPGNKPVVLWKLPNHYRSNLISPASRRKMRHTPGNGTGATVAKKKVFFRRNEVKGAIRALQQGRAVFLEEPREHYGRRLWAFCCL